MVHVTTFLDSLNKCRLFANKFFAMIYIKLLKYCHKWLDWQPAAQFLGVKAIVRVQNTDPVGTVALNGLTVPDPSDEKADRSTQSIHWWKEKT
jgi:hypothetical protein